MEEKTLMYWILGISIASLVVGLIILFMINSVQFPPINGFR